MRARVCVCVCVCMCVCVCVCVCVCSFQQEMFSVDCQYHCIQEKGIQSNCAMFHSKIKHKALLVCQEIAYNFVCVFQDVGVGHVCEGLYEQNLDKGLRTLVLWNNQVTYQAMASLSRALVRTDNGLNACDIANTNWVFSVFNSNVILLCMCLMGTNE